MNTWRSIHFIAKSIFSQKPGRFKMPPPQKGDPLFKALQQGPWSQSTQEQLTRLETLLERFLSLPGFQTSELNTDSHLLAAVPNKIFSDLSSNKTHDPQSWTPSGSTWGPLAEIWKQARSDSELTNNYCKERDFGIQGNPKIEHDPIRWNGATVESLKSSVNDGHQSHEDFSPILETFASSPTGHQFSCPPPETYNKRTTLPLNPAIQRPKISLVTSSLLFFNIFIDSTFSLFGTPGLFMRRTGVRWLVGLLGITMLASGSWLYFREAIDELARMISFSSPHHP